MCFQGQKENQKAVPLCHTAMENFASDYLKINFCFTQIQNIQEIPVLINKISPTGDRLSDSEKKKKVWWLQELAIPKKEIERTFFYFNCKFSYIFFLLYAKIVYVISISAFNAFLACTIFMKPCVKAYGSYNYTSLRKEEGQTSH